MKKFLFTTLVLLFCSKSFACKCYRVDLKKELKSTKAILHAKVLKIEYVSMGSIFSNPEREHLEKKPENQILHLSRNKSVAKVEVEIINTYKGNFNSEKLTIYTSKHGQSCGYLGFQVEKDFIIFLQPELLSKRLFRDYENRVNQNRLWTSRCSRTMLFNEIESKEIRDGLKSLD
ncbi:hypothetical protein ABN763_10060 [Spongiivirga sp. MCCC 1A20706]|uniref:hypothetical protein n=1 Tax=Spongiivirga sp. MCCC 1A20706 TaxID=3160963 RepID=UPI003977C40A